jgi:hypothetical protein
MITSGIGRRELFSHLGQAALLGVGGAVGLWLWLVPGERSHGVLASAVIGATVVLGIVWLTRLVAAKRWIAVVNAYAEREMARTRLRDARLHKAAPGRKGVVPTQRGSRTPPPQLSETESAS